MSRQHGRDGKGRRWRGKPNSGKSAKESNAETEVDLSSPIISSFFEFQKSLDQIHDKHERLVKLSRDITIESKRIIFLLQRVAGNLQQKDSILEEAEEKLIELRKTMWQNVAEELQNEDPYRFVRAYSPGLQEYIECVSFYHFLQSQTIVSLSQIRTELIFTSRSKDEKKDETDTISEVPDSSLPESVKTEDLSVTEVTAKEENDNGVAEQIILSTPVVDLPVYVSANDWLLGIADLTGELMRYAITRIGKGDTDAARDVSTLMHEVHEAFIFFGNSNRELPKKMNALRQSIKKVENACYTLLVRGSEVPRDKLADVVMSSSYSKYPDHDIDYGID